MPSFNATWQRQSLLFLLIWIMPLCANAFQFSPTIIQEVEGTSIQLELTYEPGDWRVPDQDALDNCIVSGSPNTNWVARFTVVGVSGSAIFSDGPEIGDVHYTHLDIPLATTQNFYRCDESISNPGTQISNTFKILLNEDVLVESEEFAEFEIYDRDLDGNLTFHDSIDIFIEDTDSFAGELSICCFLDVNEFETPANLTVSRSAGSAGAISVDFTTEAFAGSALPGQDYQLSSGTLHWADGDTSDKSIQVPIINDLVYEETEIFYVDLVSPTGGATLHSENFYAGIQILDDDTLAPVVINSFMASPDFIEAGQSTTLSWSVSNAESCTASGGAGGWAGSPISLPSGSKLVTLPTAGLFDFYLECNNSSPSTDTADTTVTVLDVPLGVVSICCDMTVSESDDSFEVVYNVTGAAGYESVSWNNATVEGTAVAGSDFLEASYSLVVTGSPTLPDEFEAIDTLPFLINDTVPEGTEYFDLLISNASEGFTIGDSSIRITIVDDDVLAPVVINSFTASPNPVDVGQSTSLSWSVSNADSCSLSDSEGGPPQPVSLPSGAQVLTFPTAGSYNFSLNCLNSVSTDSANTTITVEENPSVMINSFTASPNPIGEGQSTTLSWSVSNADSCTASGGAGGWAGSSISLPSGSQLITLSSAGSFTFTLQCSNSFESSDTATTTVTVETNPTVLINSFTASPNPVAEGQSTTLFWSVSNADSCTASGGAGGWAGSFISLPSGSQSVTMSTAGSYTFTLQCSDSIESSDTATTTITVVENPPVMINTFTASPNPVDEGQNTTLSWSVSNADVCTASGGAGGWSGSAISLPSGSRTLTLSEAGNYDFILQCSGASESFDSANIAVTVLGTTEPNLAVSNVTTDKTTVASGGGLTMGATLTNIGTASANGSTIRYYLSTNSTINSSDVLLGTSISPVLGVGNSHVAQFQGVVFAEAGNYWVGVCVDVVMDETSVNNNCSSGPQITVQSGADCISTPISCGAVLSGSLNTESCMGGPRGPNHYAQKFTYSGDLGDPLFIDAIWSDGLDGYLFLKNPAGLTVAENDNFTSSSDSHIEYQLDENGTHTIWATSYQPGAMGGFSLSLDCSSPAGPDLTLSMPVLDTSTLISAQNMIVSTTLRNVGDQDSDSTTLNYMLSSDANISLSDTLVGSDGAPGLGAGVSSHEQLELEAPITAGSYFIGVCAEPVAGESSQSNNCSAGKMFTVGVNPACTIRPIGCGESLSDVLTAADCTRSPRGDGYVAECLTVNASSGDALVIDANWAGLDGYLLLQSPSGEVVAENDDAGLTTSRSRIEHMVTESGTYIVWTAGYSRGATGSYGAELTCGSDSDPDLVASPVTVDEQYVTINDPIALNATVRNEGNNTSAPTTVRYLLSRDEGISLDDEEVGSVQISSLGSDDSVAVSMLLDPLANPGNYWVGICVDAVDGESLIENNCSQIEQVNVQSLAQSGSPGKGKSKVEAFGPKGTPVVVFAQPDCNSSSLSCGQIRSGTLAQGDCDQSPRGTGYLSDPYTFNGVAGDVVSLNAEWMAVDGYLYLEAPDGTVIGENDDFGDKEHSRYEQLLEVSGTYTVWPTAFDQEKGGSYNLSLGCNVPLAPDLVVEKPEINTTTVRPGQSVVVTTAASNQGNGPADATSVEFILANSPTLTETDRVLGRTDVSGLAGGASSAESLMVPLNVTPGTYWIGTCVDSDVKEINADNNCDIAGPITIEASDEVIPFNSGLNDAWYNPETNGQGFFINVFPDNNTVFLSWFTWDINRPPSDVPFNLGDPGQRWLTAQGTFDLGLATMAISLTQGGVFDSPTPVPTTDANPYGSMTVSFSDCNNGLINFDIPSVGESGSIPITRVASDNVTDCEDQIGALASQDGVTLQSSKSLSTVMQSADGSNSIEAAGDAIPGLNQGFSDAWFNPATNGQGFFVNVFPTLGQVFLSWFTYDTERPPGNVSAMLGEPGHRWITAQGSFDGFDAALTVYSTSGGIFNEGVPAPVSVADGTITAKFDDCNNGVIEYNIASLGLTGTVPIQRLARDSIPACETKSEGQDNSLAVSPKKGDVLENLCGGSVDWNFNWPDDPRASRYDFRLFRNDSSVEFASTLFKPVKKSEFKYRKLEAVPDVHRNGWTWQYKPVYTGFGKKAEWSELQSFDVKNTSDPCL